MLEKQILMLLLRTNKKIKLTKKLKKLTGSADIYSYPRNSVELIKLIFAKPGPDFENNRVAINKVRG